MGVSNMLNLGPTADSDNNFGVGGGNICDEAEHYGLKSTGPGPAMFSGPINTDFGLTSLGWSLIFVNMTILDELARLDEACLFTELYMSIFFKFAS